MTQEMKIATEVVKTIVDSGFVAVFAGGCVRDMLLGREPNDIDIATSADPDTVERIFAPIADAVIPVGKSFGVIRVIVKGHEFEIATFRRDSKESDGRRPASITLTTSMQEDVARRDLTINGMLFDPLTETLFDFVGGQKDLEGHVIRFIGDAKGRIEEDHLRILRALRFSLKFDFFIDKNVFTPETAELLRTVSAERIREEMTKILQLHKGSEALRLLQDTGVLKVILPEIAALEAQDQSPPFHSEGNVLIHTGMVLDNLPKGCSEELLWAGLLHDVSKPDTAELKEKHGTMRWTFHGHEVVGARKAKTILEGLKFSNTQITRICDLIRNHMRMLQIRNMSQANLRLFMSEPFFEELIQLSRADDLGRIDPTGEATNVSWLQFIEEKRAFFARVPLRPKPLLSGQDLIEMGMKPSPKFAEILKAVFMHQLEGLIETREQAMEFAKSL